MVDEKRGLEAQIAEGVGLWTIQSAMACQASGRARAKTL